MYLNKFTAKIGTTSRMCSSLAESSFLSGGVTVLGILVCGYKKIKTTCVF